MLRLHQLREQLLRHVHAAQHLAALLALLLLGQELLFSAMGDDRWWAGAGFLCFMHCVCVLGVHAYVGVGMGVGERAVNRCDWQLNGAPLSRDCRRHSILPASSGAWLPSPQALQAPSSNLNTHRLTSPP